MTAANLDALEGFRRNIQPKAGKAVEPVATPASNGRERDSKGHFVKVGNAPKPKAVKVVEVVEVEADPGYAVDNDDTLDLVLTDLGKGGKDGKGKRQKATVVSAEDSGHKVRFLVYTDTDAEMALCLALLGLEEAVA